MRIFLTIKTWKEGHHYIAYTPELDVASQGKTLVHAEQRLREAVGLFLEETKRMRTFDRVLEKTGFFKKDHHWVAPQISVSSLEVPA